MLIARSFFIVLLLLLSFASAPHASAQVTHQRLVLKDGTYQVVTKYERVGDRVRYYSSERAQWEEIPAELVDFAATETWAKQHTPGAQPSAPSIPEAAEIDKEEQQERARTPDIAPGLRLPDEDGVWALDSFHDQPELVAVIQNTGNVNHEAGHNVLRAALNPAGALQQIITIDGFESKIRLHVNEPALYVSVTAADDHAVAAESAVTVETHGAGLPKDNDAYSSAHSQYVIVRLRGNFKKNDRVVTGIKLSAGGKLAESDDVIPTTLQMLPGDRWMKLMPHTPLTIGDYALMEVLSTGQVNLSVWDFRVDPQGPENKNAIMQLQR